MWVARDKDGYTALWSHKPIRCDEVGEWFIDYDTYGINANQFIHISEVRDSNWIFSDLKWEDEPVEVRLYETEPTYKIKCKHCNNEVKYKRKDIKTDHNYQPSSGYEDEWEYIICPECGEYIVI